MLARWERRRPLRQIRAARAGPAGLYRCTTARLTPTAISISARLQQDSQGLHRQVEDHGGLRFALRPRLGLPRPAHREQSRSANSAPKKAQMSAAEIRRACRKYAEKYVDLQREDFKRLGVLGRWEDPYLTMSAGLPGGHRAARLSIFSTRVTYTRASSRSTGASMTAPRWPKPKSNTRTTPAPRFGCVSR